MVAQCRCGREIRQNIEAPGVGLGVSRCWVECAECGHHNYAAQVGQSNEKGRVAIVFADATVREIEFGGSA